MVNGKKYPYTKAGMKAAATAKKKKTTKKPAGKKYWVLIMPAKRGLYANIHAKKKRIAAGSGEKMRKPGSKGAPTAANFKRSAKTAKKK